MATLGLRITQNLRKAAQKPLPRVLREQHVCPEHGHTSWMYAGPEHGFSSWMTRCYSSRQTAEISPLTPDNESRASEAISPPKTDVVQSQVAPPSGGYEYFKTVIKLQMAAPDGAGVTRGDLLSDGQTSAAVDQTTASHVYGNEKTSVRQDTRLMSLNKIYRKTNGTLTAVVSSDRMLSEVTSEADVAELVRKRLRMRRVQRALPETAYNLSAYVEQSDSLQKLLAMGVDLSKVEREPQVAEHLVKVDWHTGIQPYVDFLYQVGVSAQDLGQAITKYPGLLQEDLDNLCVRLNYLKSKKFTAEAISRIVSKGPQILGYTTTELDAKLGFLQREFKFLGDELRLVVTRNPKVTLFHNTSIHMNRLSLRDLMGFSDSEIKEMVKATPKLILSGRRGVLERFDYLHNQMAISHQTMVSWPQILRSRLFIIRQRHLFLSSIDAAQYDPTKEHYVSLKALASGRDVEFCQIVAKVSHDQFKDFLKTL